MRLHRHSNDVSSVSAMEVAGRVALTRAIHGVRVRRTQEVLRCTSHGNKEMKKTLTPVFIMQILSCGLHESRIRILLARPGSIKLKFTHATIVMWLEINSSNESLSYGDVALRTDNIRNSEISRTKRFGRITTA